MKEQDNQKSDAQLIRELQEAKTKLEKLNHFKTHLLSLTSHQVKAPLAAIKGYATLLREGFYGEINEKTKEVLEKIEFAADDLVGLVNNTIDLKKVEEGKMDYRFEDADFVKLAAEAVEGLHLLAMNKNLDWNFTAPDKEILVNADEQKLRHVILNLVDNAIKYTPSGFIKTAVKESGDEVLFSVQDSGIGIPPGAKPFLFEEFVRDSRISENIKGSGIGLHIAKSIIEAHGGKIWAESEGENKGSIFGFSLKKI